MTQLSEISGHDPEKMTQLSEISGHDPEKTTQLSENSEHDPEKNDSTFRFLQLYEVEFVLCFLQYPLFTCVAGEEEYLTLMYIHDEVKSRVKALFVIHGK